MREHESAQRELQGFQKALDREGDPYQYIIRPGGRKLVVHTFGSPHHTPIFYLHGTPGWGGGPSPRASKLDMHRAYLIAPTRPGYYESDPQPGRTFADSAEDVSAVAKTLGIEKYYVIGRSGGGLHALEVLRRNEEAVQGVGILGSAAPPDTMNELWTEGMIKDNAQILSMTDQQVIDHFSELARLAAYENTNGQDSFIHVPPEISQHARNDIHNLGLKELLLTAYRKAYKKGGLGWPQDVLTQRKGLGDTFEHIEGRKIVLFYNTDDQYTPTQHGTTLHRLLPGSQLFVNYDLYPTVDRDIIHRYPMFWPYYESHFGSFSNLLSALRELKALNK